MIFTQVNEYSPNSPHPYPPGKNVTAIVQTTQASSAQGIELFEDLLWDLAALSFVPHVFQPSLTFFPASGMDGGEDPNGSRDAAGEGTRNVTETSEASVCAQLVNVVILVCPKNLPHRVYRDILLSYTFFC